jgi:hypothetical protein
MRALLAAQYAWRVGQPSFSSDFLYTNGQRTGPLPRQHASRQPILGMSLDYSAGSR